MFLFERNQSLSVGICLALPLYIDLLHFERVKQPEVFVFLFLSILHNLLRFSTFRWALFYISIAMALHSAPFTNWETEIYEVWASAIL